MSSPEELPPAAIAPLDALEVGPGPAPIGPAPPALLEVLGERRAPESPGPPLIL